MAAFNKLKQTNIIAFVIVLNCIRIKLEVYELYVNLLTLNWVKASIWPKLYKLKAVKYYLCKL